MKINLDPVIEIIVFTGPESSGKTTCALKTAQEFQLPLVEEYAREYLSIHGPTYTLSDIENIAHKQIEMESEAHNLHPLILCDTDIVTLDIWALEKYGSSLNISDPLCLKKYYFLCNPDIPWEPDPLRENPDDRDRLFDIYHSYLQKMNVPFTILNASDRTSLSLNW